MRTLHHFDQNAVMSRTIRILFVTAIFCVIITGISFTMVHADEDQLSIQIKYTVDNEEYTLASTQFEIVGEPGDGTKKNIKTPNSSGAYKYNKTSNSGKMYVATLPETAVLKSVSFGYSGSEKKWIFYKSEGYIYEAEYDESIFTEDAMLYNSEFWDPEGDTWTPKKAITTKGASLHEGKVIPTSNVKGFIVTGDNQLNTKDILFIQIPNIVVLQKEELAALIAQTYPENVYKEEDRWNGRKYSDKGFWYDLRNSYAVKHAEAMYNDATTQDEIDEAISTLSTALPSLLADLIPTSQVNSIKLYDARRFYKLSEDDEVKYSAASVQKFKNVRAAADTAYDTLFDRNGNALETNTVEGERQKEIDAVADALYAAYNDLLGKTSEKDIVSWAAASEWVASQSIVEDCFTVDSVNALKEAIQNAKAIEEESTREEIIASKAKYQDYTTAVAAALCAYYQLENEGPINVHVRIIDNYGITHPQFAIADPDMANFDDTVSLSANKTIQGLFLEGEGNGNLNTDPLSDYQPRATIAELDDTCEHPHTYVYVNGKLAIPAKQADPTEFAVLNPSAGHMDVYSGKDLSYGEHYNVGIANPNIEDRFPVLKNALHDGDDVVIVRTRAPYMRYSATGTWSACLTEYNIDSYNMPLSVYFESFGFLRINCNAAEDDFVEVKPNNSVALSVLFTPSLDVITGGATESEEASGVGVFVSQAFATKKDAVKAGTFTKLTTIEDERVVDLVTDDDGNVEFGIKQEGWYRIAVMDLNEVLPVQNNYIAPYEGQAGSYPYCRAADYMLVHVSLDDEFDALETKKGAVDDAISAAGDAKTAYVTSADTAQTAAATPGPEAVAASQKALDDAEAYKAAAEAAKAKTDEYLAAVQALADKKDQMTSEHQALIETKLEEAKQMADETKAGKDAADAVAANAGEFLEKTELKAELKACQDELEELNGENGTIKALNDKISDLQGQLDKLVGTEEQKGVIETLQEQIKALEDELGLDSEEGKVLSNLQDQITGLQGNIDKLIGTEEETGVIDTLKSQIEALEKELGLDSEEGKVLSNMKAQIDALDKDLKALNSEEGTIAAINAQIKTLQNGAVSKEEVAALTGKVTGLQSQLDALNGEEGTIAAINAQIKALQDGAVSKETVNALAGQVADLQKGLAALNGEEGTIASINAQIKALQDNTASKETVDKLSGQLADLQKELEALNGEKGLVNTLKAQIKDLQDNTASKETVAALTGQITELQNELEALNGEKGLINTLKAQIKDLQDNSVSKASVSALNEQIAKDEATIGELSKKLEESQKEIKDLNEKIADSQKEIDTLKVTDPLAAAKAEAIAKVNKYLEDNSDKILKEDADSAELAALKAQITIREAVTEEAIKKAADDAIAKIGQKIAKAEAIKAAKAKKIKGFKVSVKKKTATLTWTADETVSGYVVYRSLKKKGGYKKIATIKSNATAKYVNKKLVKGKTYYYKVRSFTKVDGKTYYGKYSAVKTTKNIK